VTIDTTTLLKGLSSARNHVLGILEGLTDEQLRRPVLPSGWNCLQLLHHLTLDDERFWVQGVIAGRQAVKDWVAVDDNDGWNPPDDLSAAQILSLYQHAITQSDEILLATPLDAAPAWWPDALGPRWMNSVADVMMHVIVETATHAGQLDAVRELIDGRQWIVVT
jgi:uncharacterized damage-inducible protein DinB